MGRPGGAGGDPTVGGGHLGVGVGSRFFGSGDSTVDKDKGPFINDVIKICLKVVPEN